MWDVHCVVWDLLMWCVDSGFGTQSPEHVGLAVAMLGLSCSKANGILVPQLGMKPTSPAFQGEFFTSGSPRNSHGLFKGIFLFFFKF